jgi:hypothetical protein
MAPKSPKAQGAHATTTPATDRPMESNGPRPPTPPIHAPHISSPALSPPPRPRVPWHWCHWRPLLAIMGRWGGEGGNWVPWGLLGAHVVVVTGGPRRSIMLRVGEGARDPASPHLSVLCNFGVSPQFLILLDGCGSSEAPTTRSQSVKNSRETSKLQSAL